MAARFGAYTLTLTDGEHRMEGELPDLDDTELEVDDALPALAADYRRYGGAAMRGRYNYVLMAGAGNFDAGPELEADDDMEAHDGLGENEFNRMVVERRPPDEPFKHWYVVMDFDGTITQRDTIDALVCQCILWKYEHAANGGGRILGLQEVLETDQWMKWEEVKRKYCLDWDACSEGMQACESFAIPGTHGRHGFRRAARPRKPGQEEATVTGYICTYSDEIEALESIRTIEELSLERVNETGIFDDVGADGILKNRAIESNYPPADIAKMVGFENLGVSTRPGFREFTTELAKRPGSGWGVISVNWSRDWIEGIILKEIGFDSIEKGADQHIPIISNSPVPRPPPSAASGIPASPPAAADEMSNGARSYGMEKFSRRPIFPRGPRQSPDAIKPPLRGIVGPQLPKNKYACQKPCCAEEDRKLLLSSEDKLRAREIMLGKLQDQSTMRGARPSNMYIGDSSTDFSCLLRSDIGIIMCDEPSPSDGSPTPLEPTDHPIVKMLHNCGFVARHVRDYRMLFRKVDEDDVESPHVSLLWARDFNEILKCGLLSSGYVKNIETARKSMEDATSDGNKAVMKKTFS